MQAVSISVELEKSELFLYRQIDWQSSALANIMVSFFGGSNENVNATIKAIIDKPLKME